MNEKFKEQIKSMNEMYKLPVVEKPRLPVDAYLRVPKFKDILTEEIAEADGIVLQCYERTELRALTMLADWLGDIVVYCRSEAMKYGIPLEEVLDIIMESNASKLGADGKPIYDERGKFLKGPNYWKPEPRIKALLEKKMNE